MKIRKMLLLALVAFAQMGASAEVAWSLYPRISPRPQAMACSPDVRVRVNDATITVCCADVASAEWAKAHLSVWLKGLSVPRVERRMQGEVLPHGDEAYRLTVDADGVRIEANALQGVRYALYTYRQTWEANRDAGTLIYYTAPKMTVDDWPALAFRAIHFCWFRTDEGITPKFMEHQVRMAAYAKFNHVVIENFGGIRSELHPEMAFSEKGSVPMSELRRLSTLARDLGVIVIPSQNLLGHASLAGVDSGKHAILDPRPEMQPLFEPRGGWNWCLSNPKTLALQKELIMELLEACGNPPYFHIGCDEAQPPSCSACCARPYYQLVSEHIRGLHAYLKDRGVRPLMWHDMLLANSDVRFKGFLNNGDDHAQELMDSLPRDIVICDWYYGGCWGFAETHETYPTLDHFQKAGFEVVTCPWYNQKGAEAQAKWAIGHGLKGLMMTTWSRVYGAKYVLVWSHGPTDAWGTSEGKACLAPDKMDLSVLWRQCGWDMGLSAAEETEFGFVQSQFSRIPEHRD